MSHRIRRSSRTLLATLIAVVSSLAFVAAASASTAFVTGTNFSYTADPGETNNVTLAFDGGTGQVTLTDSGVNPLPVPDNTDAVGANCTRPTTTTIVCLGLTSGDFNLDDMNDTLNASQIPAPGVITAFGGPGNDTLTGGGGPDYLDGQAGTDTLSGGGGDDELDDVSDAADSLDGGAGDDYFYLGSAVDGTDMYQGGTGSDTLDYSGRTVAITANLATNTESTTGGGESDSIAGFENVYGASSLGPNHLTGDDQANFLTGGPGADVINGAGGDDILDDGGGAGDDVSGDAGNDTIYTEDGEVDMAACGDGADTIFADSMAIGDPVNDNVAADCESVNGSNPGGGTGGGGTGGTGGTTNPPANNTSPPANNTSPPANNAPPPVVFTNGAFVASPQQSPKANKIVGSATIASDGSKLLIEVFNGKPSKKTRVGKTSKTGVKKGSVSFSVNLSKKASKAALKKKKGVKMTVRVTITPPSGKAFVKTFKVTVKKGKARACFRAARVPAHIAC